MINGLRFGQINVHQAYNINGAVVFNLVVTDEGNRDKGIFEEALRGHEPEIQKMGGLHANEWKLTAAFDATHSQAVRVLGGHTAPNDSNLIWRDNAVKLSDENQKWLSYRLFQESVAAGNYPTLDVQA